MASYVRHRAPTNVRESDEFADLASQTNKAPLSAKDIPKLTVKAMEKAELFDPAMTDRKAWVINVVQMLIEINPLISAQTKELLVQFVGDILPELIESIILATKGLIEVNKVVQTECLPWCRKLCAKKKQ